jgi:hypothetical protein
MKNAEIEINGIKTEVSIDFHNVLPSGYGHYSINGVASIGHDQMKIKSVTSNMETIDSYKSASQDDDTDTLDCIKSDFEDELFDKNFDSITQFFNDLANEAE